MELKGQLEISLWRVRRSRLRIWYYAYGQECLMAFEQGYDMEKASFKDPWPDIEWKNRTVLTTQKIRPGHKCLYVISMYMSLSIHQ